MFTVKRLMECFKIDREKAKLINKILDSNNPSSFLGNYENTSFSQVLTRFNSFYNTPNNIDIKLELINELLEFFGIESIEGNEYISCYWQNCQAVYLNSGDSYSYTLLYDTLKEKYYITSYGDFVEKNSKRLGLE